MKHVRDALSHFYDKEATNGSRVRAEGDDTTYRISNLVRGRSFTLTREGPPKLDKAAKKAAKRARHR